MMNNLTEPTVVLVQGGNDRNDGNTSATVLIQASINRIQHSGKKKVIDFYTVHRARP
jgi:hypothetical protein